MRKITIGTRGSKLAVIQAQWVLTKLREATPGLEANLVKITTRGDRDSGTALDKFAGQGVFVKELEKSLIDGEIDLAVHSLKDLPTEIQCGLFLAATTARLVCRTCSGFNDRHRKPQARCSATRPSPRP